MSTPHRRVLLGTVLAGGVVVVAAAPGEAAATAPTATQLRASALRVGDLVVGPAGTVVRVASVTRLASGRYLLRRTDPGTGAAVPFDAPTATSGHAATRLFVVLARGASASAVRHVPAAPAAAPDRVIDGGAP